MIHRFMLRGNRASNRVMFPSLFVLCVSLPTFSILSRTLGRRRALLYPSMPWSTLLHDYRHSFIAL